VHFTIGDAIACAAVILAGLGQMVTELRHRQRLKLDERKADIEATKLDVAQVGEVTSMKGRLDRIEAAQTGLLNKFTDHDKEDTRFHAAIETMQGAIKDEVRRLADAVENAKAQVHNLTPNADTFTELMPSPRRRRAAGGGGPQDQ